MNLNKLSIKSILILFLCLFSFNLLAKKKQAVSTINVTSERIANVIVQTNHGTSKFYLENTGKLDVSAALQTILNKISVQENVSASFTFLPGIYYVDAPITLKFCSIKMIGEAHGGIDIHGGNIESGTIFRLGKNCGPKCFTFLYAGRTKAFPSGESPWPNENLKVDIENLTFVGYNNTDVNTADGYSRFRGDKPDFRGLHWYPAKSRYKNPEKEGQCAIVLPSPTACKGSIKCELLRVTSCYFTDLYTAIDIANCDVSYINRNWFGQLVYGIHLRGNGQGMMVSDNLFADSETAMRLAHPMFSTFHNNTFAYISKCFEIENIENSTIIGNVLYNWKISTGAAAYGGFCHTGRSINLNVSGNTITQYIDSRKKTRTIDAKPNGQSFIQFDNSNHLLFTGNNINSLLTQTVVRLNNCRNSVITNNIISYAKGGNAVAETGNCKNNYYHPIDLKDSKPFDQYTY